MTAEQIVRELSDHVGEEWGMTNQLVNGLARKVCTRLYRGLYTPLTLRELSASDIEEMKKYSPFTVICNPGAHFVTIYCTPQYVLYLDPFGKECRQKDVKKFLSRLSSHIFHNRTQIQHTTSNHCGLYALLFALYLDREPQHMKLKFSTRSKNKNDKLCVTYIEKLIKSKK